MAPTGIPAPNHLSDEALDGLLAAIPTARLKAVVARRVAADAVALITHHGGDPMSRKADAQRRAAVKDAEHDKAHWEGKRDAAKDATSKATFQRGVDRNQAIIDRNSR